MRLPSLAPTLLAAALAAGAYLYGLDSIHAPTIGDEALYLQIARKTAESGKLLPLVSERGITDTKPPLLFWEGVLASGSGRWWHLWLVRLPVVAMTFATAALVGLLAARISGRRSAAVLAALVFLGFRSTIQYGRPFLTNAGEVLFLFLPLVLLHGRARTGLRLALACGLSLGAAALHKSFAVVLPGVLALLLVLWRRERRDPAALLRRHGAFLAVTAALGLAVFGAWLALDPRPDLVLQQFVVGENAGKLRPAAFLSGLLAGRYPLWRIWLGDLLNAGLYAPLVVALLVDLWRRRRELPDAEAELWLYVLAFLLFYSLPTQRQENYLLPTCAALAVLLALRWDALAGVAVRATLAVVALAALLLPVAEAIVEARAGAPGLFSPAAAAVALVVGGVALAGALRPSFGRAALPHVALGALLAASLFLAPFSRPFPEGVAAGLRDAPVLFPSRFDQGQEHYRFLLPGADVRGYPCPAGPEACAPPVGASQHAALELELGEPVPAGYEEVVAVPHLRSRHTPAQIAEIAAGRLELLVGRLVLVRPQAQAARGP